MTYSCRLCSLLYCLLLAGVHRTNCKPIKIAYAYTYTIASCLHAGTSSVSCWDWTGKVMVNCTGCCECHCYTSTHAHAQWTKSCLFACSCTTLNPTAKLLHAIVTDEPKPADVHVLLDTCHASSKILSKREHLSLAMIADLNEWMHSIRIEQWKDVEGSLTSLYPIISHPSPSSALCMLEALSK